MNYNYPPEAKDWPVVKIDISDYSGGWAYDQNYKCRRWLIERSYVFYNRYVGEFVIEDEAAAVEFKLMFG